MFRLALLPVLFFLLSLHGAGAAEAAVRGQDAVDGDPALMAAARVLPLARPVLALAWVSAQEWPKNRAGLPGSLHRSSSTPTPQINAFESDSQTAAAIMPRHSLLAGRSAVQESAPRELAIRKPATQSSTYQNNPRYAASNGTDGRKYDSSLFQTELEDRPWWEVDLRAVYSIDNVMLYNRVECCRERARRLEVLISEDGTNYHLIWVNSGPDFRTRRVEAGGLRARFVRVRLDAREHLHLQEVEVYRYGTFNPRSNPVKVLRTERIEQTTPAAPQPAPTAAADIAGTWAIVANNYRGTLTFTRAGTGWTGTVTFTGSPMHPVDQISFNPATGNLSFRRTRVNQQYIGKVSGDSMSGTFDTRYKWTATRTGAAPAPAPAPAPVSPQPAPTAAADIAGTWAIVANNYRGTLTFTRAGTGWTGTVTFTGSPMHPVDQISFNPATGNLSFRRTRVNQQYIGKVSGDSMSGTFAGNYKWTATRTGAAPATSVPPTTSAPTAPPKAEPGTGYTANLAAGRPATQSSTYQNASQWAASKGVDNVRSESSLFHTALEDRPWWEVDLLAVYPIDNLVLYNRERSDAERARHLEVLLSEDGINYQLIYAHDGRGFRSLLVPGGGLRARYVRIRLNARQYLHLQEVMVYRYGDVQPPSSPVRPLRTERIEGASAAPQPAPTAAADIAGTWAIVANNYRGTLTLTRAGTGWTGTVTFTGSPMHPVDQISFNPATGNLSFRRTRVNQQYIGKVSGDSMSGTFDTRYKWTATRTAGGSR